MVYNDHGELRGRSEAVLAVTIIMVVLSFIFVTFRMISRAGIVKKVAVDDWIICVAWLIAFGMSFSICYACAWGLGRHESEVPIEWQGTLKRANYAFSVLYHPALMASKTSILAFYLALPSGNKIFKWFTIGTLVVVNAGGFALLMLNAFQCSPPAATFKTPLPSNASCTDIVTIYLSSAPLNIITDIAILFLPMPILTSMRLPKKQKIILVVTFGFGIFVTAVDVVRIAYLQQAAVTRLVEIQTQTESNGRAEKNDFSWYASLSFMWSAVEVNVGIMCACVPALKPLVSRFMPRLLKDAGDSETRFSSLSFGGSADMSQPQRIPSVADDVYNQDPNQREPPKEDEEGPMGMMDFLTTPDMNDLPHKLERSQTAVTNTSRQTPMEPHQAFFDFVDMNKKKSLVQMTNRESIFPIAMVTILFFIWGFEYGLLDVLNQQFQRASRMSVGRNVAIHSAYYAGYFVGPLTVGRLVLKHWGFKASYMVGLAIYACGTLIFWPAAVLTSFPAYFITNFIVGFGLSILEIAANPFIALCGPQAYAEVRLNLSQAVQAVGTVIAPLIANRAFFHKVNNAPSLIDTQWAYLGISLFTIALAVVYYYVPLPEATDDELEDASERMDMANKTKIRNIPVIWITLGFAVLSQFCYVGGQEINGTSFSEWLAVIAPGLNASNYMAISHTTFAISRFIAAGLGFLVKPRFLLLFYFVGAIVFSALTVHLEGDAGIAMMIMVFFMEGPLFALIFAQALRGMGRHTKTAAVFITAAVSGGAVFSPIAYAVYSSGKGVRFSLVVAAVCYAAGTLFPIYLNLVPKAMKQCDPVKDATAPGESRPSSTNSRASRALSFLATRKKGSKDSTAVEHRERTDDAS
ncbi:MFS general substrate transporter [Polychaeton citri CBS 116435]|uniref:MFS general substrate transporter n=1 Tax=Polychaeton citri CBS 116435 TaxID=1314669 RepID=A0A9P4Q9M0_9PEZI|nr:MFS general substrate transporter [Polychaeton citri CBS 116435]